jgi:hypothetical protein
MRSFGLVDISAPVSLSSEVTLWRLLRSAVGGVGVVVGVWDEFDATVGVVDEGLCGEVELGVVPAAQHDQVGEGGVAAAAPCRRWWTSHQAAGTSQPGH